MTTIAVFQYQKYTPVFAPDPRPYVFGSQGLTSLILVPVAAFNITPQAPTLGASYALPAGAIAMGGQVPTIVSAGNPSITPPAATFTMTPRVPLIFGIEQMDILDTMPTPTANIVSTRQSLVTPPAASIVITPQVPSIQVSGNQSSAPPAAAFSMTPQVPIIVTGAQQVVNVPTQPITITAQPPTIVAASSTISAPSASFVMGGKVPGLNRGVSLPAASLAMAPKVPIVTVTVTPPPASATDPRFTVFSSGRKFTVGYTY